MKLPETVDPLDNCRRLLASAASATSAVESFRGRWSTIAATLGRLRAALDDLPSHSHPLAADLLRSLSQTLSLTLTLALDCRSPDPPAGKLRTQSDIAAASATLDQLAADADLLLRTGALLDPPPTSQSTAAAALGTSRRESVRSEARNLVTRLQIGSPASRIAALDSLIALLREDDKNILIVAAQGVVPALLCLLDSSSFGVDAVTSPTCPPPTAQPATLLRPSPTATVLLPSWRPPRPFSPASTLPPSLPMRLLGLISQVGEACP